MIEMMAVSTESSAFERNYCVTWLSCLPQHTVGEEALCEHKFTNLHDRYAISVIKDGNMIRRPFSYRIWLLWWPFQILTTIKQSWGLKALPWAKNISILTLNYFFHWHVLLYRKYFVVLIINCKKYFMQLIFVEWNLQRNILTSNFSRTTVFNLQ